MTRSAKSPAPIRRHAEHARHGSGCSAPASSVFAQLSSAAHHRASPTRSFSSPPSTCSSCGGLSASADRRERARSSPGARAEEKAATASSRLGRASSAAAEPAREDALATFFVSAIYQQPERFAVEISSGQTTCSDPQAPPLKPKLNAAGKLRRHRKEEPRGEVPLRLAAGAVSV